MNTAEARRTFKDVRTAHVGTVRADGSAHVVPLWFVWLEDAVYVTCRHGSRVLANIRRDPRVSLQFDRGEAWTEQAGALLTGLAETLEPEEPAAKRPLSAWFEKYRSELSGFGFAAYTEQVEHPILLRVKPEGLATWLHAYHPR